MCVNAARLTSILHAKSSGHRLCYKADDEDGENIRVGFLYIHLIRDQITHDGEKTDLK